MSSFDDLSRKMMKKHNFTEIYLAKKLAEEVRKAVEHNGFFDVLISGGQGMGKSTLALLILYLYYKDPDKVLANTFFTYRDIASTLLQERREIVLFDDAGVSLNKYRSMSRVSERYISLQQIVRTRASAIIYTTVHNNLIKFIRDIVDYNIELQTRFDNIVYGVVYKRVLRHGVKDKREMSFTLDFNTLHNKREFHKLYVEYNKRREEFVQKTINNLLNELLAEENGLEEADEPPVKEKLYSLTEVAEMLGMTRVGVYKWIVSGKMKAYMVGNVIRIPESEVKKILREKEVNTVI